MHTLNFRLFGRLMSRNREVYLLKIASLSFAFATAILIMVFALNEFGYDSGHDHPENIFRVIRKNTDANFTGNRLSIRIPSNVIAALKGKAYRDSLLVSRVKIMNQVTIMSGNKVLTDQRIHAADPSLAGIFTFNVVAGHPDHFADPVQPMAMISQGVAQKLGLSDDATGHILKLCTFGDTVEVVIAVIFKDFSANAHERFGFFISFDESAITALNFEPAETGVYGRSLVYGPEHFKIYDTGQALAANFTFQPIRDIYFGPRVLGDEAAHGDRYSMIILISITGLILFLSVTSFINLTTITLPHRAKELAVKKLAGTGSATLTSDFLKESCALVGIALVTGLLILFLADGFVEPVLGTRVFHMMARADGMLVIAIVLLFASVAIPPVLMTRRFARASPIRLLSADTITFPRLKHWITFIQLGISVFLIIASVVLRRQINYSLVKEPGQNHDQVVYLKCPQGITTAGINELRSGWRKNNPNILDVMAVSQLPDRVSSREIGSPFYLIQVDPGFREFFALAMNEGFWFGPNSSDSAVVTNAMGKTLLKQRANVLGVVQDFNGLFNQPAKPLKITLARDFNFNWLCVRVLEVDIRRTVRMLSKQFSSANVPANVQYLDRHFEEWIRYQDRLNTLSGILGVMSLILSCCAVYGLSVSLVRDRMKQIAVHKLFGAGTLHITWLLAGEFMRQMLLALMVFGPITYILISELLRSFVYATGFSWLDPVYPMAYCVFLITAICGFQAFSLNRSDFAAALKA